MHKAKAGKTPPRTAAAEKRVDWILRWRKWMPLVLGASGPVLTGFFLIFAADALAKGLVCLAFAVVFILIALPVQLLFGREDPKKSWRENTKESLHALVITPRELIEQPLDEKTKSAAIADKRKAAALATLLPESRTTNRPGALERNRQLLGRHDGFRLARSGCHHLPDQVQPRYSHERSLVT